MSPANDNEREEWDGEWSHVELTSGTITTAYVETSRGRRAIPVPAGERFFVATIDSRGTSLEVDNYGDYATAPYYAEKARCMLDIAAPVLDRVKGVH